MRKVDIKKNIAANVANNDAVIGQFGWMIEKFDSQLSVEEKQVMRDSQEHLRRVSSFLTHISQQIK